MSDFDQIRNVIDGDEIFMSAHSIRHGGRYASRGRSKVPKWVKTDAGIQRLLLRVFPNLATNVRQRQRAARWARVIHLYFRMGWTYSQIAEEMGITYNAAHQLVKAVLWATKGLTWNGKPRGVRGRPKKMTAQTVHPVGRPL